MPDKLPPLEKIYEAWTAISSNRVEIAWEADEGSAEVCSSNGAKVYHVKWEGNVFYSDDSATYWQGYAGYPVLAVLMLLDKIPFCEACAAYFRDVDWNKANAQARRDYAKAADDVMARLELPPETRECLRKNADAAMAALAQSGIALKRLTKPRKRHG